MGGTIVLLGALNVFEPVGGARKMMSHPCNRAVSREVRKKIDEDVLKLPFKEHGIVDYHIPSKCPFKKENGIWNFHESSKRRKRIGGQLTWECAICGKKFKSEHYLDLHMESKHMGDVTGSVCLADYCHLFDKCERPPRSKRSEEERCNDEEQISSRTLCEDAVRECFPLDSEARLLNIQLRRSLCAMMSCELKKQHKQEESSSLLSTVAVMIAVFLMFLIVGGVVVCCVDYSEDIVQMLMDCQLASSGFVRRFIQTRDNARKQVGVNTKPRTRQI